MSGLYRSARHGEKDQPDAHAGQASAGPGAGLIGPGSLGAGRSGSSSKLPHRAELHIGDSNKDSESIAAVPASQQQVQAPSGLGSIFWRWSYRAPEAEQLLGLRMILVLAALATGSQSLAIWWVSGNVARPVSLDLRGQYLVSVPLKWLISAFLGVDAVANTVWQGPGWRRYQAQMRVSQVTIPFDHHRRYDCTTCRKQVVDQICLSLIA
jgi:hypothetical protein